MLSNYIFFKCFITKKSVFNIYEMILLYFFEIISCFVYLEIIELNKNLKDNISLRSYEDTLNIINND